VGPECISQGAGICAGTIAPGCRKRWLVLLVSAPLGSRSCQAGRNYKTRGCAASCCIIPDLLHPPPQLGSGAEAADPGGRGGFRREKMGRGITEAIVSRRLSGTTMRAANMASSIGSNTGSDRSADYRGRSINLEKNKDHKSLKQRRRKTLA